MSLVVDVLPDVAMVVLALAGVTYLVPGLLKRLETSPILRIIVGTVLIGLGCCVIVINHRERTKARNEIAEARRELNQQFADLPKALAQYVKYTSPSPVSVTAAGGNRPAPPTGLVATVDGNIGISADQLNREVMNLLRVEGDPPRQKSGESDFDFVVRSNAWYADLMAKYNWQLKDRVITVVNMLVDNKVIDPRVATLAKDPENVKGIRVLSDQLEEGARRFGVSRQK